MLTIVGGPMFSGKTTWLITYAAALAPGSFVVLKPDIDTRYGKNACVSHNGLSIPAVNIKTEATRFPRLGKEVTTILIDELNFFAPADIEKEIGRHHQKGRHIIGIGLLYDYLRKPFGATLTLSRKADRFIELFARCDGCEKDAAHSYRKVRQKKQFLLGAGETYGACCTACWESLNAKE